MMAEIPQEGELSRLPVARLLLELRQQRYEGALQLAMGRTEKCIRLQAGVPIFAESNLPSESLGVQLLDAGAISREQHARVSQQVQERGVKEGSALLELGVLSPKQIFQALKDQVRRRILSCFAWSEGTWALEAGEALSQDAQAFRTEPVGLVFEGLVRHWGADRLLAELTPHLDRIAEPQAAFEKLSARLCDDDDARTLCEELAAGRALGTALQGASSPAALAAAWILDAAGGVAWKVPEGAAAEADAAPDIVLVLEDPADAQEAASETASAGETASRTTDARVEELRSEVLELHAALAELDHYGVLSIAREARAGAVKNAYLKAAKRFHPDALSGMGLGDVRAEATALFARIARAYATLSNPESRSEYNAQLDGNATADADRIANAEALYRKGDILLKAGDFAGALAFLQPAVELWPEDPAYRSSLGWALFKKTPPDRDAAREHLERSVELDDRDARAHYRLGLVLREAGDKEAGEEHLATAKKIDPKVTGR
jgi:tetratricopeptide (TPR) repeat protein